ncbi:iron-sulfur cluster assembly scaffold protein [Candidatus Micrarchaeota archaeon CG10_big_fil_rev_8_21_14_0_10_45_29]|nr:MAG: iron-sulfur cluster assembly scaffold protein [Candidatus Micrarchaeota archaeon CG10_big_fil_rev_8_21_14_0_10_45_29]
MYNKKVISRFKKPKFAGEIKNADAVGEVGNLKCGDIMRVYIKVKEGKISQIKFKTYGCVAAIASSDILCELAKGKTLEEAQKITGRDVLKEVGEVPALKVHCSILAQNALKKAIEEYKKKSQ